MIRAIAIDDEPHALQVLQHFCLGKTDIELIQVFTNTALAEDYLNANSIDLIFLDIQMPSISGIDFYKNLTQKSEVIFTTAYSEFAIEGYNVAAIDYLLKPFKKERFEAALTKALERIENKRSLLKNKDTSEFIWIRADYSDNKVLLKDILYIEGFDDYIKIHLANNKKLVARMTMKKIQEILPSVDFIRVHRSFIVPKKRVMAINSKNIITESGEIPIGKSFALDVEKSFGSNQNQQS